MEGLTMKYLVMAFFLFAIGGAYADDVQKEQRDFLNGWLSSLLNSRADKSWAAGIYAAPMTAAYLGTVAGISVKSDEAIPLDMLVVRCEASCPKDSEGVAMPVGTKMASYRGVIKIPRQ